VVGTDVQPFVAVGNVFDATYNSSVVVNAFNPPGGQARYYEPAPGRHFSVGVNVAL
jgi:outer membrane receptor protein involved in Fe transport